MSIKRICRQCGMSKPQEFFPPNHKICACCVKGNAHLRHKAEMAERTATKEWRVRGFEKMQQTALRKVKGGDAHARSVLFCLLSGNM